MISADIGAAHCREQVAEVLQPCYKNTQGYCCKPCPSRGPKDALLIVAGDAHKALQPAEMYAPNQPAKHAMLVTPPTSFELLQHRSLSRSTEHNAATAQDHANVDCCIVKYQWGHLLGLCWLQGAEQCTNKQPVHCTSLVHRMRYCAAGIAAFTSASNKQRHTTECCCFHTH
jgi:hypothetical protein